MLSEIIINRLNFRTDLARYTSARQTHCYPFEIFTVTVGYIAMDGALSLATVAVAPVQE